MCFIVGVSTMGSLSVHFFKCIQWHVFVCNCTGATNLPSSIILLVWTTLNSFAPGFVLYSFRGDNADIDGDVAVGVWLWECGCCEGAREALHPALLVLEAR